MTRVSLPALLLLAACGSKPAAAPPPPESAPESASAPAPSPSADASPTASIASAEAGDATPIAANVALDAGTAAAPPSSDDAANDAAGVAYLEAIQVLYKEKREALTTACWLHAKSSERAYAGKAVLRVGSGGKLISTKTDGTDDATSACVDKQIKKWKLPPPKGTATVTLPLRLHRD